MSAEGTATVIQVWRKIILEHRITLSFAFVLAALLFIRPNLGSLLIGMPFIFMGEWVRIWASGHIHKMREVTRTGPYAVCRHPLYLGHFFITIGFLLAGNNLWVLVAGILVFWLIFSPTMQREEELLCNSFGKDYEAYKQAVPGFFPRWHADALEGGVDWSLVRQHREFNNIIGIAVGIAIVAALGIWRGSL